MLYVDDTKYSPEDFERWFSSFASDPVVGDCAGKCFTVRLTHTALWIALCLYIKANGGSVFPLPPDTPFAAARRRAELSGSNYLLFDDVGDGTLQSLEVAVLSPSNVAAATPSLIQMSSGTTGEPKCIARSWSSIDIEVASYVQHFEADALTPIVACPVHHSYGLISGVFVALHRGVTPVVLKNLNPKFVLRRLHNVTRPVLYSSPILLTAVTMLAKHSEPIFSVMTSGTLLPSRWFESIRSKVSHLHQQYGCSEVGCIALGQDIEAASQMGRPLPHLEVVTGRDAAAPKEIVVKFPGGRVVGTRDLGYLSGNQLHFVSRMDDMINVAGLNVYPSEVEEVVLQLPGVRDAVAFKRNHSFGNDQVCLYFASDTTIPHNVVRQWCTQQLAAHQVPMNITQVSTIPRLPNGKVSRKALAESEPLIQPG